MATTFIDISGQTFNRLTALEPCGSSKAGTVYWRCRCVCGATTKVSGSDLRRGRIRSCGCIRHHGKSRTIEYRIFYSARARAKQRGLKFTISPSDIQIPLVCPVLGIELEVHKKTMRDNSPTLDRIYPDRGYVPGNVAVVSLRANRLKSDCSPDDLIKLGQKFKELACEA